jgi:hypothetical protein
MNGVRVTVKYIPGSGTVCSYILVESNAVLRSSSFVPVSPAFTSYIVQIIGMEGAISWLLYRGGDTIRTCAIEIRLCVLSL